MKSLVVVIVAAVFLTSCGKPQAKEPPERGGGYHVTEHVKRYYQTTLV